MLTQPARAAGFTLLELVVTLTIFGILVVLAVPSMSLWINNTRVRAAADSLQNGLRLAQAESLRRSRQVVFSLTNGTAPQSAIANGNSWSIYTIPSMAAGQENPEFIEAGELTKLNSTITVTGPAAICFNSVGRLVTNTSANTGVGTNCTLPATYDFTMPGIADRPMRVLVALGGQVHMCDPHKSISTDPDGCP